MHVRCGYGGRCKEYHGQKNTNECVRLEIGIEEDGTIQQTAIRRKLGFFGQYGKRTMAKNATSDPLVLNFTKDSLYNWQPLFHVIFRARFIVSLRPSFLPGPGPLLSSYLEGAQFYR